MIDGVIMRTREALHAYALNTAMPDLPDPVGSTHKAIYECYQS